MKVRLFTAALLAAVSSGPVFAGAVSVNSPGFVNGDNSLGANETIMAGNLGYSDTYSGDPYVFSAQGYGGSWYSFYIESALDVSVTVETIQGGFSPGFTVWASGNQQFNGGNAAYSETSTEAGQTFLGGPGYSTPTVYSPAVFNATGNIGDPGTLWMSEGHGGNLKETLGYAVSGSSVVVDCPPNQFCITLWDPPTAWEEAIFHGAHDVSITNTYESGVTGSVAPGFAQLQFNDMQPGWYTTFIGGTHTSDPGGIFLMSISAVPELETWAMMAAGMGFLGWRLRKQQEKAVQMEA